MNKIIRNATILASVALVARHFVQLTKVSGNSMFPELHDDDRLLIDKTAYAHSAPEAGDVVVFAVAGQDHLLIKRIIGVPGDHIVIRDGTLWINGEVGNDEYTADGATDGNVDIIVPEGRYFVLGDNRLHSKDSRAGVVGCIPDKSILGKVSIRLYPPGRVFKREVLAKDDEQEEAGSEHKDEQEQ
ncbi:MAG: signal peptidase I [Eubacterium sp.]|nr:signal peptidase I [Eubacterium sp.]